MFKKLKQRIEQEGTTSTGNSLQGTQEEPVTPAAQEETPVGTKDTSRQHTTIDTRDNFDSFNQNGAEDQESASNLTAGQETVYLNSNKEKQEEKQQGLAEDDADAPIVSNQELSESAAGSTNHISEPNQSLTETSSAATLSSNSAEPTPRRKNLAATVLKYGEEISVKNQLILELERKLLAKEAEGGGDGLRELKKDLQTSESVVQKLQTTVSEQEETIGQLVLSLSKLEATEANDKSVIVDLECKLCKNRDETLQLTDKLQSFRNNESSLQSRVESLQSQVEQLTAELREAKEHSSRLTNRPSSNSLTENRDREEVSQLKVKLSRAHSHSKQLEQHLTDKDSQLCSLVIENKTVKSSLENSKQQALDELLSVSQEESGLRAELSALVQKHNALQTQYKTQSRLLGEKQRDMMKLEEALQKNSRTSEKEKEQLIEKYRKQTSELERVNETLRLSLANETQSAAKVREQLDNIREEALDKQLDDEKQLTDLHEQLSSLRGEIRQLERNKKKDLERFTTEISTKDASISKLEETLTTAKSESESSLRSLNTQLDELRTQLTSLTACYNETKQLLTETENRLESTEAERDDLYLRNAALSSKLETCKMELKSALGSHEQDKSSFQQKLESREEMQKSSDERFETMQEKITLLHEQVHVADGVRSQLEETSAEIVNLKDRLSEQEKTIVDKTKSIRIQQQTINDLKKTIKRELKGVGEAGSQSNFATAGRSQELIDRVRSSPALTDLDRYDSPVEDNLPLPARHKSQTTVEHSTSNSSGLAQQYRHEVNGFCGHKDINFEYLKNVVFSFLISRDSESVHLVKALAVLLEFTPAEEKLLKETVEWKMSWWSSTKKPAKKIRK